MPTFIGALAVWAAIILATFPELARWLWHELAPDTARHELEPEPLTALAEPDAWPWPDPPYCRCGAHVIGLPCYIGALEVAR